jgi:hypothetical protein
LGATLFHLVTGHPPFEAETPTAVRRGEGPIHARREVNMDALAKIEEGGKTVDLAAGPDRGFWTSPTLLIWVLAALGVSVLITLAALVIVFSNK